MEELSHSSRRRLSAYPARPDVCVFIQPLPSCACEPFQLLISAQFQHRSKNAVRPICRFRLFSKSLFYPEDRFLLSSNRWCRNRRRFVGISPETYLFSNMTGCRNHRIPLFHHPARQCARFSRSRRRKRQWEAAPKLQRRTINERNLFTPFCHFLHPFL